MKRVHSMKSLGKRGKGTKLVRRRDGKGKVRQVAINKENPKFKAIQ